MPWFCFRFNIDAEMEYINLELQKNHVALDTVHSGLYFSLYKYFSMARFSLQNLF